MSSEAGEPTSAGGTGSSVPGARADPPRAPRIRGAGRGGREPVLRRLRYLRNWEAANAVLLPALIVSVWGDFDARVRLPPLVLAAAILLQGAGYWHLKIREVRDGVSMPPWFGRRFDALRRLNAIALAAIALLLLTAGATGTAGPWDLAWGIGLLLFAAAEFVNYFHLQLMHDSPADWRWLIRHRRLRPATPVRELRRGRRG
jgi:hypothetical protein